MARKDPGAEGGVGSSITDAVVNIARTTPEETIVIFQDVAKEDWAKAGKLASES